jgi:Ca2+-binding RTX toxin-like protein
LPHPTIEGGIMSDFESGLTTGFPAPGGAGRMVVADFDNDGDADILYQTGGGGTAFQYARSNGNGTFTIMAQAASPFAGLTLPDNGGGFHFAGDFDGDGDIDLLAAAAGATGSYFRNDGATFSAQSSGTFPAPLAATRMVVGDFNNDGRDDILYQVGGDGTVFQFASGNGDGTFSIVAQAASPFAGLTLPNHNGSNYTAGDFDGDGDIDLQVGVAAATGSYLRNNGNGTFTSLATETFPAPVTASRQVAGDFDADGDLDILYQTAGDGSAFQYAQRNADGTYTIQALSASPFAGLMLPNHTGSNFYAADFDGDGDTDLLAAVNSTTGSYFYQVGKPPEIAWTTPTDNATGVSVSTNIDITFDEAVSKGSGNIYLYRADGVLIETINVGSAQVTGVGSLWTIDPSVTLAGSTGYYVRADAGTFHDGDNAEFAGIADNTTLNFTTGFVNQPPSGTDKTVTIFEDATYTFTLSDFGFSDPDGNGLSSIFLTTTPSTGALFYDPDGAGPLGSNPISAGSFIAAWVTIYYVPGANINGPGSASFTFQVEDDGISAGGGSGVDPTPNTFTFNITPTNDAPTATNLSGDAATWLEGGSAALLDVASNAVIGDIDSLNFDSGTLTVHIGAGLVAAQDQLVINAVGGVITTANTVSVGGVQIATYTGGGSGGGDLVFTFDADATPATVQALIRAIAFTNTGGDTPTAGARTIDWTINDGDGTANGGNATRTFASSVDVLAVNDAPSGANATVHLDEDGRYVFSAADFGFSDVDGNSMLRINIDTLPDHGTLYYDPDGPGGISPITFSPGVGFTVAMLGSGGLYYVPGAEESGTGYDSFGFQVVDNGGTANGGVDTDPSFNIITFDVASINDTPVNTVPADHAISGLEGQVIAITGMQVSDADAGSSPTITINLSTDHGTLHVDESVPGGAAVMNNGDGNVSPVVLYGTLAQVNATLAALNGVTLNTGPDYNGPVTIGLSASDGGPTMENDFDQFVVDVLPVNDAPVNLVPADGAVTGLEDQAIAITGVQIGDVDEGSSATFSVSLATDVGTIHIDAGVPGGTALVSGNDSNLVVLSGTLAQINATLVATGAVLLHAGAEYSGDAHITVTTSDGGATGVDPGLTGGAAFEEDSDEFVVTVTAVDDAPSVTIEPSGDPLGAFEAIEQLSISLKQAISVADIDTTGEVTVTLSVTYGVLAVDPGTSGVTVDQTFPNEVTLTGTVAEIEDLLNANGTSTVTYTADSDFPPPTDTLTVEIDDGTSTVTDTAPITVTAVNDAPEIDLDYLEPTATTWTEGDGPTLLAPGVTFDDDNDSHAGATLTVTIGGATSGDQLILDSVGTGLGQLSISGSDVLYEGEVVGTWSGGDNGNPLVVTFNADACYCSIELAMASVQYANTDDLTAASARSIDFTFVDGGGTANGGSDTVSATVDLDVLPQASVIAGAAATGAEDTAIALTGVVIDGLAPDPASDVVVVRLHVAHGTLEIRDDVAGGLAAGGIVGEGSDTLVLTGTQDAINATLAASGGLTYQGDADFSGADALAIDAHLGVPAVPFDFSSFGGLPIGMPVLGVDLLDFDGDGTDDLVAGLPGTLLLFGSFGAGTVPLPDGGTPTAFAFGDFDGDGLADIAFAVENSGANHVAIISSLAQDIVAIAEVDSAFDLVTGDFNGDGLADLATTDGAGNRIAIMLQDPVGGFAAPTYVSTTGTSPSWMVTGDFNNDNVLDLLVANSGAVDFLAGNGDGTFDPASAVVNPLLALGHVAVADFNRDGVLDLAVAAGNSSVGGVVVALGNGDGSFAAPLAYQTNAGGTVGQLALADFNGDGAVDIVVANMDAPGTFSVLGGYGDGTFAAPVDFDTGDFPLAVAYGDPDGDGDMDLVIGTFDGSDSGIDMVNNDTDTVFHEITGSKDITVTPVDDAAVAVDDNTVTVAENAVVNIAVLANDRDVDGPAPAIATVNGVTLTAGQSTTLASGAIVELLANGTLTYDPAGQFHPLVSPATAAATGASNGSATDSFTYTVNGGASATVTVTVLGIDGPGDELLGGPTGDTITGTSGRDVIRAFGDTDLISGGDGNDVIYGNGDSDTLSGNAGTDRLYGGNGDDVLQGGDGNDVLIGNLGGDIMAGGLGNDIYYVGEAGDVVTENLNEGTDIVRSQIDYVLTDNVEELFVGGAGRAGTGNGLANVIHGADASNVLSGLGGDDVIRGDAGRDTIDGGAGADLIDGGAGKDTLTGGADRDVFQFRDGDFGTTRALADVITDFSHAAAEKIQLNLVDADTIAGGNQAFAWIGNGAFTGVAGQLHYAQAGGNTYVEGDTNGDGTADFVIMLIGTVNLVAGDFVL